MIEALLAGVLLLIMALGVLPLFTQSLSNNRQGRTASDATNEARSELERMVAVDFFHADLTIADGETELTRTDYYSETKRRWISDSSWNNATDGMRLFTRDVTVRQYNFDALDDELLEASEAQVGGADPGLIHFKEILVEVEANSLRVGPNKQVTLRAVKSF
ncbi:MAG TPA: hypothetical protein VMT85_05725 [Thermoanaerobaculia bacterium]|nr:hypothetical protein [Thermoanaerobaculia bacterium]